jgi:hypothetical protein
MGVCVVLGLGPSLGLYIPKGEFTIGVNDIWTYYSTDVVVCLDKRGAFTADRLRTIDTCKPKAFYSQMACWDRRTDFKQISFLNYYPEAKCDLSSWHLQKSYCSPFVAVQIAFKFYGATRIELYGVDLIGHSNLKPDMCQSIKRHFINLKKALTDEGCELIIHGEGILKDI